MFRIRTRWPVTGVLAAVLVVAPAAASDLYQRQADRHFDQSRKPAPGKALVHVLCKFRGLRMLEKMVVLLDGKPLGIMAPGPGGTFMTFDLDPGKHEFAAWDKNASVLQGEFLADRTYFLAAWTVPGLMTVKAYIAPSRVITSFLNEGPSSIRFAKGRFKDLQEITTTDAGREWIQKEWPKISEAVEEAKKKAGEIVGVKPEDGHMVVPWEE